MKINEEAVLYIESEIGKLTLPASVKTTNEKEENEKRIVLDKIKILNYIKEKLQ